MEVCVDISKTGLKSCQCLDDRATAVLSEGTKIYEQFWILSDIVRRLRYR